MLHVCQKLNTSRKPVYVTKLSDALFVQPNTFRYIDAVSKKFIAYYDRFTTKPQCIFHGLD